MSEVAVHKDSCANVLRENHKLTSGCEKSPRAALGAEVSALTPATGNDVLLCARQHTVCWARPPSSGG